MKICTRVNVIAKEKVEDDFEGSSIRSEAYKKRTESRLSNEAVDSDRILESTKKGLQNLKTLSSEIYSTVYVFFYKHFSSYFAIDMKKQLSILAMVFSFVLVTSLVMSATMSDGSLVFFGTEYQYGQDAKLWLQLLDENNSYVDDGICFVDVYTPANEELLERATMTNANHDGIYYYDFNVPIAAGVYPSIAVCYFTATETIHLANASWIENGTDLAGDYTDTWTPNSVRDTIREDTNDRISAGYNFTDTDICGSVSESLLSGVTVHWEGRWAQSPANDHIKISVWNYSSNSWFNLTNEITTETGDITVSNYIALNNTTAAGVVNSTAGHFRIRFVDHGLPDSTRTDLKTDYVYIACDEINGDEWQELKGASEIHVTSDSLYIVENTNATMEEGGEAFEGSVSINITLSSGTYQFEDDIHITFPLDWDIPCEAVTNISELNESGYWIPQNYTIHWHSDKDYCEVHTEKDLDAGVNYLFQLNFSNHYFRILETHMRNVMITDDFVTSICNVYQNYTGLPNYTTPLQNVTNNTDPFHNACNQYFDAMYRYNLSFIRAYDLRLDLIDNPNYETWLEIVATSESTSNDYNIVYEAADTMSTIMQLASDYSDVVVNVLEPSSIPSYYAWFGNLSTSLKILNGSVTAESSFSDVRYAGGTEYQFGEEILLAYQFIDTEAGNPSPITDAWCNVSVWLPNETIHFSQTNMTYLNGSAGVYYYNFTLPDVEGVYSASSWCIFGSIVGFGSSTFHVAPWANQIGNITGNFSDDLYFRIRNFMMVSLTNAEVTNMTCLNNQTLRVFKNALQNISGEIVDVIAYQDFVCDFGCDVANNICTTGSAMNLWLFFIASGISLYLMFGRKDPILNIIGSLGLAVMGGYIMIAGIDFITVLGLTGSVGGSWVINNQITLLIGFVYFGLALYRIVSSWMRLNAEIK